MTKQQQIDELLKRECENLTAKGRAMTDFNSLPLAEQLKALQAGDELHLRGGGWLPFVKYYADEGQAYPIASPAVDWNIDGNIVYGARSDADIIRVVRPGERKGAA